MTSPSKGDKVGVRDRLVIEVTPEMLEAGASILTAWKYETDYVGEKQAAKETFLAMVALATFQEKKHTISESS